MGFEDSEGVFESKMRLRYVAHAKRNGVDIKSIGCEWKSLGIGNDYVHVVDVFRGGLFEHGGVDICEGEIEVGLTLQNETGNISSTGGAIQDGHSGGGVEIGDKCIFP